MLLVVLNRTLKKILSLVLNCEKKRDTRTTGVKGETTEQWRSQQSIVSMGSVGDRAKDEKSGRIPDPWFN